MQSEKHDTAVDGKWQLPLPVAAAKKFVGQPEVTISLTKTGCLGIYSPNRRKAMFDGTRVSLRRGRKRKYARITIPAELRGATSFFYGPTVTVVCKRGYVEVWPRPPQSNEKERRGRPPKTH